MRPQLAATASKAGGTGRRKGKTVKVASVGTGKEEQEEPISANSEKMSEDAKAEQRAWQSMRDRLKNSDLDEKTLQKINELANPNSKKRAKSYDGKFKRPRKNRRKGWQNEEVKVAEVEATDLQSDGDSDSNAPFVDPAIASYYEDYDDP